MNTKCWEMLKQGSVYKVHYFKINLMIKHDKYLFNQSVILLFTYLFFKFLFIFHSGEIIVHSRSHCKYKTSRKSFKWTDVFKSSCDINKTLYDWLEGNLIKLRSADSLANANNILCFNVAYLNTLVPNRFLKHNLLLNPGMPLMLLHNINPWRGLNVLTTDYYNVMCLE